MDPFVPAYAGFSFSTLEDGLDLEFYCPSGTLPFESLKTNDLATTEFAPSDAFAYGTDLNLNGWWSELRPLLESDPAGLQEVHDELQGTGLLDLVQMVSGFQAQQLLDLALHPNLVVNIFDWTGGEFAWARLPDSNRQGQLLLFELTGTQPDVATIDDIKTALADALGVNVSEIEDSFVENAEQTKEFLVLGYPAGVLAAALARSSLEGNSDYEEVLEDYLPLEMRGLIYADFDPVQDYLPPSYQDFTEPLTNGAAYYYVNDLTSGLVIRVPPPRGRGGGGGGGGGGAAPNVAPTAAALVDRTVQVGKTVSFDGTGSIDTDGWIVSYAWDFGDGNTATEVTPTHTYDTPGTYTVTLTVTDNGDATSDPTTCTITVQSVVVPEAIFELSNLVVTPAQIKPGEPVNIKVDVSNTGNVAGTHELILKINEMDEVVQMVTLGVGEIVSVEFTVDRDIAGRYNISVGSLSNAFTVEELVVVPRPAEFVLSDLSLNPNEVTVGKPVTISVKVSNVGESEGSHTVTLKVNQEVEAITTITLAAFETTAVTFDVSRNNAGIYNIEVDGLPLASFQVTRPMWPLALAASAAALLVAWLAYSFIRRRMLLAGEIYEGKEARREIEERAMLEAEEKARIEALEAKEAEEKAKREAKEAKEQARRESKEAEKKAKREAKEKAKRESAEAKRAEQARKRLKDKQKEAKRRLKEKLKREIDKG